jgi:hypothetical protein
MDRCFWLPDDDSAGPNTRHKAWLLSLFRGSEDDETIHEQGNARGRLEYPFAFLPRVRLWRSFLRAQAYTIVREELRRVATSLFLADVGGRLQAVVGTESFPRFWTLAKVVDRQQDTAWCC